MTDRPGEEEARAVRSYLAAYPAFLAENPALYRALHPPRRVHGESLADHMAAMLAAARAEVGDVLAAARAERDLMLRAAAAAITLIGAPDPLALAAAEWPALLGLDGVAVAAERHAPGLRALPAGAVDRLLGGRDIAFRDAAPAPLAEAAALHGEAYPLIRRDALIRLPGPAPRLLALGARDAGRLPCRGGAAPLRLLADALARALDRPA